MNLAFHLFSALCFGWLAYKLLAMKRTIDFSHFIWRSYHDPKKVKCIYWPVEFFQHFTGWSGITLSIGQQPKAARPAIIDVRLWVDSHCKFNFCSIKMASEVVLTFTRPPSDAGELAAALQETFKPPLKQPIIIKTVGNTGENQ